MTGRRVLDPLLTETRDAQLALVAGHGRRGTAIAMATTALLRSVSEPLSRSVSAWAAESGEAALDEATRRMRSVENIERLEVLGYRVGALRVGERLPLAVFAVIDLDDADSMTRAAATLERIAVLDVAVIAIAVPIARRVDEAALRTLAGSGHYRCVLPFEVDDRSGVAHAEEDLIAMAARTLMVLSSPSQVKALLDTGAPAVVRAAAAFVDACVDELSQRLSARVAAQLVTSQLGEPAAHRGAFDEEQRTRVAAWLSPDVLARRLLDGLPFVLHTAERGPWSVRLSAGEIAFELHGAPPARWVAILHTLREFFRFTKARRWREQLERAQQTVTDEIVAGMAGDVVLLHTYPRGSDRVLAWIERLRTVLDTPFEIARPPEADFDRRLAGLRRELQRLPAPLAVWARVALVGALGIAGAVQTAGYAYGAIAAVVAGVLAAAAAAAAGLWLQHRNEARLQQARRLAIEALAGTHEAQVRDNLIRTLLAVRERLLAQLAAIRAVHIALGARAAETPATAAPGAAVAHQVAPAVPAEMDAQFLAHLGVDWNELQRAAAGAGALQPVPADGEAGLDLPLASAAAFAGAWLAERRPQMSLAAQIAFRSAYDGGFRAALVEMLERRSRLSGAHRDPDTVWIGPPDLLDSLPPGVVPGRQEAIEVELLGCLRLTRQVVHVPAATSGVTP